MKTNSSIDENALLHCVLHNTSLNYAKLNPKGIFNLNFQLEKKNVTYNDLKLIFFLACLVIDQILFIGRVSKCLYTESVPLKKLLNESTPNIVLPSPASITPRTPRMISRFSATPKKMAKEGIKKYYFSEKFLRKFRTFPQSLQVIEKTISIGS